MPDTALRDFAVELRKLAYTMPAGHDDRLTHPTDKKVQRASQIGRSRTEASG